MTRNVSEGTSYKNLVKSVANASGYDDARAVQASRLRNDEMRNIKERKREMPWFAVSSSLTRFDVALFF